MNPVLIYLLLPVALLVFSVVFSIVLVKRGRTPKRAMAIHFLTLLLIVAICVAAPIIGTAASDNADAGAPAASETVQQPADNGMKFIGAALSVGLAAIGGGIAVAAGAPAAIGATVEDPKSFGKSMIFVALGEGFGLYGLLIAIMCLIL